MTDARRTKKKMVIDCDPGNDDSSAIFMALTDPDVDVIAVTCVEGNTNVRQTALNALRALKVANRLDIPVFAGCNLPLLGDHKPSSQYHGNDGLGDVPDPSAPDYSSVQPEHGVQALIKLSKEHKAYEANMPRDRKSRGSTTCMHFMGADILKVVNPECPPEIDGNRQVATSIGELIIVAIGPLTNLALAQRLDPEFGSRLKSCWIMGGNYLGKGNISVCGEFNFYFDPEAAFIVLNEMGCPITLVPWETCVQHGLQWAAFIVLNELGCPITLVPWETCVQHGLQWDTYHKMRNIGTPKAEFMKAVDQCSLEFVKKKGNKIFIPADEALMACTLNNDVIKNSVCVYASVETKGQYTWGQMVVDWQGLLKKSPNVTIVTDMDQTLYEKILYRAFE